jgi:hypothetical protein
MKKLMYVSAAVVTILILFSGIFFFSGYAQNNVDSSKIILIGSVSFSKEKINSDSVLWDRGEQSEQKKFDEPENGATINVDVLNCAGYIASAKATYDSKLTYWQLQMIPETVASDAVEKVRQCLEYPEIDYLSTSAFAVSPTDEKRKQVKLKKLEKPSVYTLPISVQLWAKDDIGMWADTDSDGEVDLVTVSGLCGTSEENICSKTLFWNGLRWIEIAYSAPA